MMPLAADDFRAEAYVASNRVGISDYIQLTVEVSGATDAAEPQLPALDGMKVVGTSSGSSTSISIVNGRMEKESKVTYSYSIVPQRTGRLVIPPISVRSGNQTRTTAAIEVNVVEGTTQRMPLPQGRTPGQTQQQQQVQNDNLGDNLFVRAALSKSDPYVGEPITVTYTLYSRYDVVNLSFGDEPSFAGFWKDDAYVANRVDFSPTTLNGQRYNAMKLRTVTLIPNQGGALTIPSQSMTVDIMTPRTSFFDLDNTRRLRVSSDPIKLQVRQLPAQGQPADYSGAIGSFTVSADVSTADIRAGEPFTYTITISGSGNFDNFTLPKAPAVNHILFMDPEVDRNLSGGRGKVTLRYPAYADEQGAYRIPAVSFSYFDTGSRSYKTLRTQEPTLRVQAGDPALMQQNPYLNGKGVSGAQRVSNDIEHIVYTAALEKPAPQKAGAHRKVQMLGQWWMWLLWLLMLGCVPASLWLARRNRLLATDAGYTRQRMADKILRKYLQEAEANLSSVAFYAAAQGGLSNYLADKLRLPRGSVSDTLLEALAARGWSQQLVERLRVFFQHCNEARFMPGGFTAERINSDYNELLELVTELSRKRGV